MKRLRQVERFRTGQWYMVKEDLGDRYPRKLYFKLTKRYSIPRRPNPERGFERTIYDRYGNKYGTGRISLDVLKNQLRRGSDIYVYYSLNNMEMKRLKEKLFIAEL